MFKLRVRVKGCWLIAKVKISSNFVININQSSLLSKKYNHGFFKLSNVKRNKLEFTGPIGISMYERLKKPISEYDFFFIVEQIIDAIQKLEKIGLSRSNLILDLKYVFFNEATKEISFIYLPIATPHSGISVMTFMEQLIYSVKLVEVDSIYLSNFSYYIRQFNEFDADKVEEYIKQFNCDIVNIIKQSNFINNAINNVDKKKESIVSDNELTDIMTDDEKTDLMSDEDEATDILSRDKSIGVVSSTAGLLVNNKKNVFVGNDEDTSLLDDEATELFVDDDMTDLLDEMQGNSKKFPVLIRTLTEEVIRVDKPVFRIGKEEGCVDYIVTNNIAISRSHADIISRSGKYFVFDLRSKNKSYINNRVLPAEQEVEIFSGDVLKLANEEFLFQV